LIPLQRNCCDFLFKDCDENIICFGKGSTVPES
jgi:hypothetical protein